MGSSKDLGVSRTEAAVIRSHLKLRENKQLQCWEVYTTAHGTGVYRWFRISHTDVSWWKRNFPEIKIVDFHTGEPIHGT